MILGIVIIYFRLNLTLVLLIIIVLLYLKHATLFFSHLEETTLPVSLFYPVFHWGDVIAKVLPKARGLGKR